MPLVKATRTGFHHGLTFWSQSVTGIVLSSLTLALLTFAKLGEVPPLYRVLIILAAALWLPIASLTRCYHKPDGYGIGILRLLGGWSILLGVLVLIAFITKSGALYSREVILLWMVIGLVTQISAYALLHKLQRRLYGRLRRARRSLIIGTGEQALALADTLRTRKRDPVIGMVSADEMCEQRSVGRWPVLGPLTHLRHIIRDERISRVYVALPMNQAEDVQDLYIDLLDAHIDLVWVPDISNLILINQAVGNIGQHVAVYLNESPLTAYPASAFIKAVLDRLLALLALIAFSPLMLVTAVLIKLSSPGPILFRQERHGMNGGVFHVYKFRSMRMHDDQQVRQASRNDDRITPIGRFIRRTSIDELPQFLNVLKGEMALVGPRPHAVTHNNYYADKIDAYMARHRIKPGITGLAQISGYRGETETIDKMRKRVEYDLEYIKNWSVWLDIKILLKTPLSLFDRNIY